jgi:glutamyl/glutaminyl-tRNA synthetase
LEELRAEQESLKLPTKYDKKCRYLSKEEIKEKLDSKIPYTVRLKVPENKIIDFFDEVR